MSDNTYTIHRNKGSLNEGIGQINAAYVVNNNGIMTFYTSDGSEVFWYVLQPGEAMSVYYEEE